MIFLMCFASVDVRNTKFTQRGVVFWCAGNNIRKTDDVKISAIVEHTDGGFVAVIVCIFVTVLVYFKQMHLIFQVDMI